MEGTPQLLTDVKFTQLRKGGYDPEEVDNYLERINDAVAKLADNLRAATERAEVAQAQLADARRAQTEAEAEAERLRSGLGSSSTADEEQLAKVLVLAQRAADQAIEEANSTATKTVADARAKAVNLLADAEQERERLLVKAREKADAAAEDRARILHEQVEALAAARADLELDVEALAAHLEGERERLRAFVESVSTALDEPAGLRLAPSPELRDTPIPTVDLPGEPETPSPFAPWTEVHEPHAAETEPADPAAEVVDDPPGPPADTYSGIDEGRSGPSTSTSSVHETEGEAAEAPETIYLDTTSDDTDTHLFGDAESGEPEPTAAPVQSSELFSGPDVSPLGEPDAEADAAMRAFFERDLDDPAATGRGRFGRRR